MSSPSPHSSTHKLLVDRSFTFRTRHHGSGNVKHQQYRKLSADDRPSDAASTVSDHYFDSTAASIHSIQPYSMANSPPPPAGISRRIPLCIKCQHFNGVHSGESKLENKPLVFGF